MTRHAHSRLAGIAGLVVAATLLLTGCTPPDRPDSASSVHPADPRCTRRAPTSRTGSDGGLIGIHYQEGADGAVSHGRIRLSAEAIAAVDALPLGTPVQITP